MKNILNFIMWGWITILGIFLSIFVTFVISCFLIWVFSCLSVVGIIIVAVFGNYYIIDNIWI